jgi:hypothetical protein
MDLNRFFAFLCRHPSITSLQIDVWITKSHFEPIAKALVHLEDLDVGLDPTMLCKPLNPDSPLMPFPKLKTLVIEDREDSRISLEDFESLVRSRRHLSHPQGRGATTMMESLEVTVNVADIDSLPWRKSSLLAQAQQNITIWDNDKSICTIELRWPN